MTTHPGPVGGYVEILVPLHDRLTAFHWTGSNDDALTAWLQPGELKGWSLNDRPIIWTGTHTVELEPGYRIIRLPGGLVATSVGARELLYRVEAS